MQMSLSVGCKGAVGISFINNETGWQFDSRYGFNVDLRLLNWFYHLHVSHLKPISRYAEVNFMR
jgi:hypothetical protein